MTKWDWNGARWWKFDFHTHTPASVDYGKGSDQPALRERSPEDWLLDYMRAGVDCVAITDHNTGSWTDPLKKALQELRTSGHSDYRNLYLFPGMEISVQGGIHLLAILDPSKTSADLDALRGAVEYEGTPGHSDGVTRKSFVEVVDLIVSADGIAIPAHVDEKSGLFQEHHGTSLQQILNCSNIFALESANTCSVKPPLYVNMKTNWTEVVGSDSHHPAGNADQRYPGSHFTWVKMGSPNIDGLRLALMDGQLSVQRSLNMVGDPNEHGNLVIESVEIRHARYMGRAEPFIQTFNPWLNAIIGGRGTGKSTVVEFLRNALHRKGELPEELKQEFEKYKQVYADREDSGLLTDEAVISAIYRKNGYRYRVQWSSDCNAEVLEEAESGEWCHAEGDIQQRFPVRIYSQKQIFQLARTPLALLRIVDEAPEVGKNSWLEKWKTEESRFLSVRAQIREIERFNIDKSHQ